MIADLLDLPSTGLAARFAAGHPIAPEALAGQRYRGVSLGLPTWVDRLAWKTFEKDFHASPLDPRRVRGWNVRLRQTGVEGPVEPLQRRGRRHTFGHFVVRQGPAGTELDYGVGANARLDPVRRLRDPLVALVRGERHWLLGRSDVVVSGRRVPTPSWFVLEHLGSLPPDEVARP